MRPHSIQLRTRSTSIQFGLMGQEETLYALSLAVSDKVTLTSALNSGGFARPTLFRLTSKPFNRVSKHPRPLPSLIVMPPMMSLDSLGLAHRLHGFDILHSVPWLERANGRRVSRGLPRSTNRISLPRKSTHGDSR
jgi:hypothetical protein